MTRHWLKKGSLRPILSAALGSIIAVFLFLFVLAQGGFLGWFLFYTFAPIVLYHYLLLLYPFQSIKIERLINGHHLFAGDTLHLTIRLKRRWTVPFFLMTINEYSDQSTPPIATRKAELLAWFTREASLPLAAEHMRRGTYHLNTIVLEIGDPFGLFRRSVLLNKKTVVYVYPNVRQLSMTELEIQRRIGDSSGQETDLANFSGVRAYRPSDRPSWLDWKSAARTNTLVTKQFEPEHERKASIVLISRKHEDDNCFETAVSYTASLVKSLLEYGFTVRLTYRSGRAPLVLQENTVQNLNLTYTALAKLTKDQTLETSDVRMSGNKHYLGYAVSTDIRFAEVIGAFATRSKQRQVMYYISNKTDEKNLESLKSSWLRLRIVAENESR
ncbi:DUF58 domain-containing protein [Sporolactobacillus shoreicorticis]|uniref:DUF58 domain-containing protein n=1 Tax=Sporolactobacillus shoreicorticis TaxID=1923877 RepID=A0ABW5S6I3_9BACL|nr:DUF58 domain-containing protein [Sporolactobacillus shoreicorticis]MCO7128067.1 DUF58 domain-containing protein [Sporolactobacillus shoreicorticis]